MAVWNGIVSASADDARETAAANTIDDAHIVLNAFAHWAGFRFPGCPVAPGDTVTSAILTVAVSNTTRDDPNGVDWFGEDVADCQQFTTAAGNISTRTRTTAMVDWPGTSVGATDHNIDVTTIFQEIITNGLYTTGNAIGLILSGVTGGDVSIRAYDNTTTSCARLTVTYTVASGGGQAPRTMHQFRMRRT